jgi:hypothetical protein
MKRIIYLTIAVLINIAAFGQKTTITSVADGSWTMPTTWSPSTVPLPGDIIIINNNVILNTDFAYSSGSITINSGASLAKDASMRTIAVYGGSLVNNGSFEVDRLALDAGSITNSNTMIINQAFFCGATFTNDGLVEQLDSLLNSGTIYNNSSGRIETVNLWNDVTLNNDGHLDMTYFLNTSFYSGNGVIHTSQFYNVGTALVNDSVIIDNDFLNSGILYNITNVPFLVGHDFMNSDSTDHDAVFINDGFVYVGNDFTNTDTLKGIEGSFCISVYSWNLGYIKGTVDICDLTCPTGPPYIDLNSGVLEAGVTSCTHSCSVGIEENNEPVEYIDVYPNPFSASATFTFHSASSAGSSLTIYDMTGNAIINKFFGSDGVITITKELPSGLYFYLIKNAEGKMFSGKLISL